MLGLAPDVLASPNEGVEGAPLPPKDDVEEMRQWVDLLYDDALRLQPRRVNRWRENMAFLRGYQHLIPTSWTEENWGSIDARQEFEVENRIAPIVYQYAAKMLNAFPLNPEVVAPHDGIIARAKADASLGLLRSFARSGVIPLEEVFDAVVASAVFGGAWLQPFWDPMAGPRQRGPDGIRRPLGDVRVRYVSLLDGIIDPTSRNFREDRHVFHRQAMPLSEARERWPTDLFGEEAQFLSYGARANEGFAAMLRDDRGLFETVAATEPNQIVEVIWYYERPTFTHLEGRLICFSGPTVLDLDLRLPSGVWPFYWVPGPNRAPGVRIPDGLIHNLKSPQRSLNHALSKIRENASLCVNPAMLAPVAAGVQTEKLDDLPGTVLRYNPAGGKPEWMQVPGIPPGLYEMTNNHRQALSDVSSFSDVSQGTPQGDLSGRAILNLDQLNNLVHGPQLGLFRESMGELIKACLLITHERYDEGRLVQLLGENDRWVSRTWKGADFEPDIELRIDPFSQKPTSPAAKFAQAVEIANLQGYADTPEARRFREAAGADNEDSEVLEIEAAHKRRAKQEDLQLVTTGMMPPPLFEDNDDVHLQCHELTLLSDEIQNAGLADILRQHIAGHEQNAAMKMQAMMPPPVPGEEPPGAPEAPSAASPPDGGHPAGFDTARDVGEAVGQGISPGSGGPSNAGPGG